MFMVGRGTAGSGKARLELARSGEARHGMARIGKVIIQGVCSLDSLL